LSTNVFLVTRLLSSGALYPDFGLLWLPISPPGHQGGLSGATFSHEAQPIKNPIYLVWHSAAACEARPIRHCC